MVKDVSKKIPLINRKRKKIDIRNIKKYACNVCYHILDNLELSTFCRVCKSLLASLQFVTMLNNCCIINISLVSVFFLIVDAVLKVMILKFLHNDLRYKQHALELILLLI